MSFSFRLRVTLPSAATFVSDDPRAEVPTDLAPSPLIVKAIGTESLSSATKVSFVVSGFGSPNEARIAGDAFKDALHAACVAHQIGVDTGRDAIPSSFSASFMDGIQQRLKEDTGEEVKVLPDVHGLSVVEDSVTTRFLGGGWTGVRGVRLQAFFQTLTNAITTGQRLNPEQRLAFELFNRARFDVSPRARYLALITCVEILAEQRPREPRLVEHLERLIALTDETDFETGEKSALKNALSGLKLESIGAACKRIVAQYAPEDLAKEWPKLHDLRHKLVHGGVEGDALQDSIGHLDLLVRAILLGSIGQRDREP